MAAGQQKKRLNAASVTIFNLQEQPFPKKKKLLSPDITWGLRPHISLKWDENRKKAVARSEQIGLTWRELSPFVNPAPSSSSALADVYSVPEEIFQLKDMNEVLSYEVWKTCLSDSDRNFLGQCLPRGVEADEAVKQLLVGENLHFGNPVKSWSANLVTGNLHPDSILHCSQHVKASKKHYYNSIRVYRDGMVKRLLNWKERWESCRDPEKEIVERIWRKGVGYSNLENSLSPLKPVKIALSIEQACDECKVPEKASRYISYIKITRREHQLVKNMKTGGDGILSKSLARVLDGKSLKLLPYEEFEEEESRKLRKHWLELSCKDLPLAHEEFRNHRASMENFQTIIKHEILKRKIQSIDEVDGTKPTDKCELLTPGPLYCAGNKFFKGGHEGHSTSKKVKNSEATENQAGPFCAADNDESEGNSELLDQQSEDYSESEVSEGSRKLLNLDQDSDMVSPQVEDSSRQIMEDLDHQQAENSLPQHHLNSDLHRAGGECSPSNLQEDPLERIPSLNSNHSDLDSEVFNYMAIRDNSKLVPSTYLIDQKSLEHCGPAEDGINCKTTLAPNTQDLRRIPSLNFHPDPDSVALYQEPNGEIVNSPVKTSACSLIGNPETSAKIGKPHDSIFSAKNSWDEIGIRHSYSGVQGCNPCPYIDDSSLGMPHMEQNPTLAFNLEDKMLVREGSSAENGASLLESYGNRHQNIHVPPFLKGQNILMPSFSKEHAMLPPYSYRQLDNLKASGLPSFRQTNGLPQPSMFHPFQEQRNLFDQKQTGDKELYIQQIVQKAEFSDCLGFPAVNGGFLGDNLLFRPRHDWHMLEPSISGGPCLNEGGTADGSLYSILPEYSKISNGLLANRSIFNNRVVIPGNFVSQALPDVGTFSHGGYGYSSNLVSNSSEAAAGSTDSPSEGG